MAKLIVSLEGSVIRDYPIDKERVTIGRKPHNDIQIENLAVSGEHACIVTILNDSFLEDLGSTNGTVVNGNSVKKHILQSNDVIEIGKYKLKYVSDAPAAGRTTIDEFEKTMVMRAPALAKTVTGKPAGGAVTSGPRTMGMPSMPPPTPMPTARPPTFPGGRDAAASGSLTSPGSKEAAASGPLTSPGGRAATTSGSLTSPGSKEAAASGPMASSGGRAATTSGSLTSPGGKEAAASGPMTSPGAKEAAASGPLTSPRAQEAAASGPLTSEGKAAAASGSLSTPAVAVASAPGLAPAPEPSAKAVSDAVSTSTRGSASAAGSAPATPAEPALGAIQILSGSGAGKELDLVKNLTTLGKPGVQVAVITRRPQGYFITHVEGASAPEVNGKALDAQACLLKDHDVIELAGVKMEFFLKK